MRKLALVAVVFSMFAGVVGCGGGGSSVCDDYATKAKACTCDKLTDATQKAACDKQIDDSIAAYKAAGGAADAACQAALDSIKTTCP